MTRPNFRTHYLETLGHERSSHDLCRLLDEQILGEPTTHDVDLDKLVNFVHKHDLPPERRIAVWSLLLGR